MPVVEAATLEARIETRDLDKGASAIRKLGQELDHVDGKFGKASSSAGGLAGGIGSLAKIASVGAATGIAAFAGLGLAGVKMAGDLQQSVANISTIKPEIDTSAVFKSLNEMQTRVPQSAKQLGDSLYNVFSSIDVSVSGGLELVEKFAKGAVGASTSAETFGTAALGVMNAYKIGVEGADHVSDVFFNTIKRGVVTGPELASSLGPVTQSAKAAGVSLDELGGFLVGVTKEGGPASQNINNLNNFLQKITTEDAQKAISDLGVKTLTSTGKFRPMMDVLTDLKPKLAGMTEAARNNALQAIFPDAQARIGAQTILSQLDAVKEAITENQTTYGAADAAYAKMASTFGSQTTLLKNTFMSMLTTIGANILPMLTPLISMFAERLPGAFATAGEVVSEIVAIIRSLFALGSDEQGLRLQELLSKFLPPETANAIVMAVTGIINGFQTLISFITDQVVPAFKNFIGGDVVPKLQEFGSLLTGTLVPAFLDLAQTVAGVLGPALTGLIGFIADHKEILGGTAIAIGIMAAAWLAYTVATTAAGIATAIVSSPLLLIGVALAAVATGVILLIRHWDDITAKFPALGTAADAVQSAFKSMASFVTDTLLPALGDIASWIGDKVQPSIKAVVDFIETHWGTISEIVESIFGAVKTIIEGYIDGYTIVIKTGIDAAKAFWETFGSDIETIARTMWEIVKGIVQGGMDVIQGIIKTVTSLIQGDWSGAWDGIKQILSGVWTIMHTLITGGLDMMRSLVSVGMTALGALWDTAWSALKTALSTAWDGIKTAVSTGIDAVVTFITELPGKITTALGNLAKLLYQHGVDLVQGLLDGIASKAEEVGKAAAALGKKVLSALNPFGDSPWPGMFDHGADAGEGLALGVMSKQRRVLTASKMLGDTIEHGVVRAWNIEEAQESGLLAYTEWLMGRGLVTGQTASKTVGDAIEHGVVRAWNVEEAQKSGLLAYTDWLMNQGAKAGRDAALIAGDAIGVGLTEGTLNTIVNSLSLDSGLGPVIIDKGEVIGRGLAKSINKGLADGLVGIANTLGLPFTMAAGDVGYESGAVLADNMNGGLAANLGNITGALVAPFTTAAAVVGYRSGVVLADNMNGGLAANLGNIAGSLGAPFTEAAAIAGYNSGVVLADNMNGGLAANLGNITGALMAPFTTAAAVVGYKSGVVLSDNMNGGLAANLGNIANSLGAPFATMLTPVAADTGAALGQVMGDSLGQRLNETYAEWVERLRADWEIVLAGFRSSASTAQTAARPSTPNASGGSGGNPPEAAWRQGWVPTMGTPAMNTQGTPVNISDGGARQSAAQNEGIMSLWAQREQMAIQSAEMARRLPWLYTLLGFGENASRPRSMAAGGYVPARPGGTLIRAGERGEGEYVIPESRYVAHAGSDSGSSSSGSSSVVIQINAPVYGVNHLEDVVATAWSSAERKGAFRGKVR